MLKLSTSVNYLQPFC